MSERLRRSQRLLAVQTKLNRLAEWSLIELQSKIAVDENQQRSLLSFISEQSTVNTIFYSMAIRKLQFTTETLAITAKQLTAQKEYCLDARRCLRSASRLAADLEAKERQKDGLRELAELIEGALRRSS